MIESPVKTERGAMPADSDRALRYLKASEAAAAAFAAAGFAAAPDAIKVIVASHVNSSTQDIPASSLSSSSGIMAVEAAAGVNMVMASLTDQQRDTIKNGGIIEPGSQAKLHGLFGGGFQAMRGLVTKADTPSGSAGNGSSSAASSLGSAAYGRAFAAGDPSFLRSIGINNGTAGALAGMGFRSQAEVKALVNDANVLHIDKNHGAIALGKMKSDDPTHYASHMNFFKGQYKHGLDHIHAIDSQIDHEKDPAKRAALIKQRDEAKAKLEAARLKERAKSKGHPKAQQGFDDVSRMMEKNSQYRHEHNNDGARHSSDHDQKTKKARVGLDAAGTHAQKKIAKSASAEPAKVIASGADDVFGKADDGKKPETAQAPTKPAPTKAAGKKTPSPSVG